MRTLSLMNSMKYESHSESAVASNHNGLPEDDWEAVLLNACELIREIEP